MLQLQGFLRKELARKIFLGENIPNVPGFRKVWVLALVEKIIDYFLSPFFIARQSVPKQVVWQRDFSAQQTDHSQYSMGVASCPNVLPKNG